MKRDIIYTGDNAEVLATIPDECIDLVVTSPPYDDLRTYGGHSWDFETVARELARALKPGGVIVWVVADATIDGSETLTSMRQAIYFKDICGLNVHDTMIWHKPNAMPLNNNRYEPAWEYILVCSKGKPTIWNPAKERSLNAGTKSGGTQISVDGKREPKWGTGKPVNEWKVRQNVFSIPVGGSDGKHPAVLPYQLAAICVETWSNPGDIVLDPFAGSGTTLVAAKEIERHYIGIEINPEYVVICNKRLMQEVLPLFKQDSRPSETQQMLIPM